MLTHEHFGPTRRTFTFKKNQTTRIKLVEELWFFLKKDSDGLKTIPKVKEKSTFS
jgi:hypothetical protein